MANDITQRLGFDASRAIEELRKLQNQLNQFKRGLQSVSGALHKFPSKAQPAIKAFRELSNAANKTKLAMQGLGQAGTMPASMSSSAQKAANSMNNLGQQASSAGQKVQTSVTQSFNQGTQSVKSLGKATKDTAKVTQQAATTTSAAATKTGSALEKTGKKGNEAARVITLSWKTVIRVVQAQVIVRALSRLVSMFGEAHQAAMEFSLAVGEVATIAGDALGPVENISASVLKLSSSLGIAADEVAEGLYQTLSNQVVDAGDALRFEEQAAKLSIATHSELKEAVNALSSVMNSYNLEVSEVGQVSDVLFKTIELGRLRMGEFGDVLGRLTPLTAALGISYQEMSAALAALTQKGIPAHTAITQLTQLSQKLLRPTAKLQELYEKWGVETGPEAIRRFGGLQGVLLKMKDATAGNDKEFADLLGRVRAMVAGLNLTSNESNALTAALDAMAKCAGDTSKALELVTETAGFKAKKAWNDLANEVIKFGKILLEISTPIAKALKILTTNLDSIVVAMVAVGGAALALSIKNALATISFHALTAATVKATLAFIAAHAALILFVAAAVAGVALGKLLKASFDTHSKLLEKQQKELEELTKAQEEHSQAHIEATRKEFAEITKITCEGWAAQTSEYRKAIDIFEASSKAIGRTLQETLSSLFEQRKKGIEELKKATLEVDSAIKDSMQEVADTTAAIAEDAFNRTKRHMTARQQLWAEIERAQRTAADAREMYAEAGANEEKVHDAREMSHIAEKRAKEAVAHAKELGNYGDLKRAEDELDRIRADRIRAEITFQIKREKYQDEAHKNEIARLKEIGLKVEELYLKLQKLADPMVSAGVLKSIEQRRTDAERIAELVPEIERNLDAAFDFSMFEKMGGTEAMAQIKTEFQDAFKTAKVDWTNLQTQLQNAISAKTYAANITIKIENEYILKEFEERFGKLDLLGDPGKFGAQMEQVLKGIVEQYENLQRTIDAGQEQSVAKFQKALEQVDVESFYNWLEKTRNFFETSSPKVEELRLKIEELAQEALDLAGANKPWTDQMRQAYSDLVETATEMKGAGELSENVAMKIAEAFILLHDGVDDNVAAVKALNNQLDITPEAYEKSLVKLTEMAQKHKDAADAQEEITDEAADTEQQLEDAKQAAGKMPAVAVQAKNALSNETDQARRLKIELQGATQAQKDLTQNQAQQPGGDKGPEQPVPPEKTKEELMAQAQAARQLTEELLRTDSQFATVLQNVSAVTDAMLETSEIAIQLAGNIDQIVLATDNLQAGFDWVIQQITASVNSVNNLNTSIDTSVTAINSASNATANWANQLNNCASAGHAAASAMNAAASAAYAAAAACAKAAAACSGGKSAYYGGPASRYYQDGGSVRGQDRIPIMASPGEFIVSAKNARRFAAQLQAMNAGSEPNYRDHGGSITNIGDVNVSVTQGESTRQTAREIATALRRELRRGTSRL